MSNDQHIKDASDLASQYDFDKMCEGVSYSKAELRVEQYGTRVLVVTEGDFEELSQAQLCELKKKVGLNYVMADVNGGETEAFVYEAKASINSIAGMIGSIPVGWKSGESVIELRGNSMKLIAPIGLLHLDALTILGDTASFNTIIQNIGGALLPWPVRCPS